MLDLQYWSRGCLVDPPLPPQWAPGATHVHSQCLPWSPGPSIVRSFVRFDFGLDFGLVLGPFWVRLGGSWDPVGSPNRVKLDQKCVLNRHLFENDDVQKTLKNVRREPLF